MTALVIVLVIVALLELAYIIRMQAEPTGPAPSASPGAPAPAASGQKNVRPSQRIALPVVTVEDVKTEKEKEKEKPAPAKAAEPAAPARADQDGALRMLAVLQREGRLLDFLMEKIDGYSDAQVGAAVRSIHSGCRKAITEHVELEPVLPGKEESSVTVPAGFDAKTIRLVGNVKGSPPFKGTLRHHGWKAKAKKPLAGDGDAAVVAPAEVEL